MSHIYNKCLYSICRLLSFQFIRVLYLRTHGRVCFKITLDLFYFTLTLIQLFANKGIFLYDDYDDAKIPCNSYPGDPSDLSTGLEIL